jgi:hypothetical protein
MKMVFTYYISCALPYLIAGVGILKYGWHGYNDKGWGIPNYVIAALIVSIINAIWGLILLPLSYLNRQRFNRIIAAMFFGGLCPILIAIVISIFA